MAFLAAIPAAGWIAGGAAVLSGIGSAQQSQAAQDAANYNLQVNGQNKQFALQDQARAAEQAQGRAIAAYGASGVQTDTGSPSDVLADSIAQATLDRYKLAYNYDSKANLIRKKAAADSAASTINGLGGIIRAAGTFIPMFGGSAIGGSGGVGFGASAKKLTNDYDYENM